jgi:hypothetical protein
MIENNPFELPAKPEPIHGALSINVGTVLDKQCVQICETIEETSITPAWLTVHIHKVTVSQGHIAVFMIDVHKYPSYMFKYAVVIHQVEVRSSWTRKSPAQREVGCTGGKRTIFDCQITIRRDIPSVYKHPCITRNQRGSR